MGEKMLKSIVICTILSLLGFAFVSCGSTKVEPEPVVEEPVVIEEPAPEEPVIAEPVIEEPEPEPEPQKSEEEMEYERSVGSTTVSVDTFTQDKNTILRIIKELSGVMKNMDYKLWRTYLDKDSIEYWSRPANLRKAQNRLPVKGLKLNSLEDYFKYVFVPARARSEVNEIRYVSDTYVKAVQVKEDKGEKQDIIYYYFNKIDNKWMLHLPPLE